MTKVKERKSESWKPGLFHDDGFISKNKKRKDKRMSLNLSAKKMETDEFIPIKKSMLALGKAKEGSSKFLSPALDKKQTPKKKDTPLPTLSGKKQNTDSAPNARKLSFAATGTPKMKSELAVTPKMKKVEISNTPKSKSKAQPAGTPQVKLEQGIKSSLKKKAQKFIDYEAEEGEEPITDKDVKPYEKGQKRKSISFKFDDKKHPESDSDESDSDDDDSDDSDELTDARDFFDHEASEGEETDDDSGSEEDEDDDEDDDNDDSKDDLYKSFVDGDDDLGTDDEEGSEDSDEEEESDDVDDEESDDEEELPPKVQEKKKPDNKTKVKPAPTPTVPLNQNKKDKAEKLPKVNETPAKKIEPQANTKQEKKPKEKKTAADETSKPASDFVGYIKFLPDSITVNQIKTSLSTEISPKNIVSIVLKRNNTKKSNKCLVYVSDEDSLESLQNKTFTIGQTTFKLYKARESKKIEKTKPLLFLPRVPLSIDRTKLESLIAKDIGAENIVKVMFKGTNNKLSSRNVLIELTNEEVLKKALFKGSYVCDGTEIIVRQAFESGFQIPIYKVVFSGVPEKVSEAVIKKAIEAKVGQGTVINVKFSFKNKSFAFISLHTEQAQKKLLQPGMEISIQGTKVKIIEFKPRLPKKRAPGRKKSKPQEGPAAKKQKTEDSSPAPKSGKFKNKKKHPKPAAQPGSSPVKKEPQTNVQTASPKKQKPQQQQQQQQSPSSPSKNKKAKKAQNQNQVPDKKANLSNKLEAKKNKFKDKKMKKKQATSDE